jgi:hypothetical protein
MQIDGRFNEDRPMVVYLATPYTHPDPQVVQIRFKQACRIAGKLVQEGHIVFCPIAHTHPIAIHNPEMPQFDSSYWLKFDEYFLRHSDLMIIAPLEGWKESKGVEKEFEMARNHGIPVQFMDQSTLERYLGETEGEKQDVPIPGTARAHFTESQVSSASGARQTRVEGRYDLICPTGLRRLAIRYELGAKKYGDLNWCQAHDDPEYQRSRLNHLIKHVVHYLQQGNASEDDDLAAICWNAMALMHFSENCKHHES